MRHFVRHEVKVVGTLAGAQPDILPVREGARVDAARERAGAGAGVHADVG